VELKSSGKRKCNRLRKIWEEKKCGKSAIDLNSLKPETFGTEVQCLTSTSPSPKF
jgi:hypothetical protein